MHSCSRPSISHFSNPKAFSNPSDGPTECLKRQNVKIILKHLAKTIWKNVFTKHQRNMICADQNSKWSYLHALHALVYHSNLRVSVCGLSRKQKLENHCSDLTSHDVVKNTLHYLIVWVINKINLLFACFFISFLQITVDLYDKPTEQPGVQGFGQVVSPLRCQIIRLMNGNFHPFE